MNLRLVSCEINYWEFVRLLRQDERVKDGFIRNISIDKEQQKVYMYKYHQFYKIALVENNPAGYVGVIDDDIRVCTHPDFQGIGVGRFMINECMKIWPNSFAKVKIGNINSEKLFLSCGFEIIKIDTEFTYFKKNISI